MYQSIDIMPVPIITTSLRSKVMERQRDGRYVSMPTICVHRFDVGTLVNIHGQIFRVIKKEEIHHPLARFRVYVDPATTARNAGLVCV